MKLLLFLEHHFFKIDGKVYCDRIVNYNYLTRYLDVFEEVTVCARFSNEIPAKRMEVSGKGVSFLPLSDFQGTVGILKNYKSIKEVLTRNINKYDAVIMRSPSPISFVAYKIVKKSGIPFAAEVVINPKTMFCKDSYQSKLRFLVSALFVEHTKALCNNANGVSYVTERVLQKIYPCRGMKVNNDLYFTEHYSTIDLHEDQYTQRIPDVKKKRFIITHTGYMDSYSKGHMKVIEVAAILLKQGYDVAVSFIGTGELESKFREYAKQMRIEDKVEFCGSLNGYSEVQKQLLKADVFLFPTCSEGLPRSLIEAMANSLPCVSSPVDGITELLDNEFLVDYKDTEAMADSIKLLINDYNIRKETARRNYSKAKEYQYDILRKRRKKFYSKLKALCK